MFGKISLCTERKHIIKMIDGTANKYSDNIMVLIAFNWGWLECVMPKYDKQDM